MIFHLYGFFIALGILVAAWISEQFRKRLLATRYLLLADSVYDILPWVLIPGIIGARLYHVLDYWEYYGKNLLKVFFVWEGGLGIFGGIMGGATGIWIFLKLKTQNSKLKTTTKNSKFSDLFLSLLDVVAIGLPVGQAIGRLGNYFNQELYGLPTELPWGIYISPENRLPGYENFFKFHPLFAYEGLWCLMIFIILFKILNTKKPGRLFFTYLGLYSFGRFWLEFLRIESWLIRLPLITNSVRVAQLISLGLMIVSGYFLTKLHIFYIHIRFVLQKLKNLIIILL